MVNYVCIFFIALAAFVFPANNNDGLLKVGVVGLTHDHVHAVLSSHKRGELKIVGIAETNVELAKKFSDRYGFPMRIVFDSMEEMLNETNPTVVSDYGSTFGHLKTVELAAPRGIHVMVEKPLAVSLEHAKKMQQLATQHSIHLLTNYETTWYASHHDAKELIENDSFGGIRRLVVHDGHRGPAEIGCSKEFLQWLTDPKLNGGGALMDFGCYGANLATWLLDGQRPESVTAVTQQIKPEVYPDVEDEATILLTYPKAQVIIQASWNWNYNRKDLEIYCKSGSVHCLNGKDMSVRLPKSEKVQTLKAKPLSSTMADPYKYFRAVVDGEISQKPTDLSSLENNMFVMEILDAAKRSAKSGKTVQLPK